MVGAGVRNHSLTGQSWGFIMNNGWIKLHRKIINKAFSSKPAYLSVWIHLLLSANHAPKEFMWNGKVILVNEGQFITGRDELSKQTGVPGTTVERILNFLENEHQIGQQKTSKYRLITIVKWDEYQKSDSTLDNKWTTNGQQMDTNKNVKKDKNEKKYSKDGASVIHAFEEVDPKNKTYYGNTTQREACDFLIGEYGLDVVLQRVAILPKTNTMQYFPNITTPSQLRDKWVQLENAVARKKVELSKPKVKVI